MHDLEHLLFELRQALREGITPLQVKQWASSPLLKEHELVQATHAVLSKRMGLEFTTVPLKKTPSGTVTLFEKGFFPWKGLPYPKEHAELGLSLLELGQREEALAMASFQQATLCHDQKIATSLFSQEGVGGYSDKDQTHRLFFEALGIPLESSYSYRDVELGFFSKRKEDSTLICLGSGCKSGLGLYLQGDVGIINWGPQTTPVGNSSGFGLAGRAQKVRLEEKEEQFSLSFQCRLASPLPRETGFSHIKDSGFSGQWIEAHLQGDSDCLSATVSFPRLKSGETPLFLFFGKGEACWLGTSHKLSPRSLDRYQGPVHPILLSGKNNKMRLEAQGALKLEIIPLAGDESYWGANFLIAYTLHEAPLRFTLQKND